MTIGPDGAREGTAADNPDQPSFETTTDSQTSQYRFVDGKWRLDTGALALQADPTPCPLLPAAQVQAALGRQLPVEPPLQTYGVTGSAAADRTGVQSTLSQCVVGSSRLTVRARSCRARRLHPDDRAGRPDSVRRAVAVS